MSSSSIFVTDIAVFLEASRNLGDPLFISQSLMILNSTTKCSLQLDLGRQVIIFIIQWILDWQRRKPTRWNQKFTTGHAAGIVEDRACSPQRHKRPCGMGDY
jgi:hypothetical protein